ncbi:hypothetical protein ESZ00_07540 [Silvibacterium dinghuense]|uniref:Uncharacterized protein n=1 Tax=Silvibacterium dinghuense TaxID=1560006 RepID=A0A4Q1SJ99_9BACT|nr:hypothetical protein ESZ00_07540 [Silvibacterium dinghuense]
MRSDPVSSVAHRAQGSGLRAQGSGLRAQGSGLRAQMRVSRMWVPFVFRSQKKMRAQARMPEPAENSF